MHDYDLNPRPSDLKPTALVIELSRYSGNTGPVYPAHFTHLKCVGSGGRRSDFSRLA